MTASLSLASNGVERQDGMNRSAREGELSEAAHTPSDSPFPTAAESASRRSSEVALITLHLLVWAHSEKG